MNVKKDREIRKVLRINKIESEIIKRNRRHATWYEGQLKVDT